MARAASQGLNIKETSEKFASNIKMASRYNFKNGIDGINKMTLLSQKLKFNLESISSALDLYSSLDSAISASAQLQVLGGAYAANFSNPVLAAGQAMLDPEEFTKTIIDTFAQNAIFDREKGEVTMSPIERAKLKEASKILQMDFDNAWNMAAQSAKVKEIESQIDVSKFSDNQRAFLANTAQYDVDKKIWTITKMTNNGAEKINISDLKSGKDLEGIQEEQDFEKYIQGDVHSIRSMLAKYLGEKVDETKTAEEIKTGQTERLKIFGANFIHPFARVFKNWVKDFNIIEFAILGVTTQILRHITTHGIGDMARGIRKKGNGNMSSNSSRAKGVKGSIWKRGFGRGLKRIGIKTLGKNGLNAFSKSIPVIGTVAAVGMGAYDAYQANNTYKEKVNDINNNASLSTEEKNKAISQHKKERNTSIGGAVGGAVGSILAGAAVGAAMSGPLAPIGALVGGVAGYFGGDALGSYIGSKINTTENQAKPKINNITNDTNNSTIVRNSQISTNYVNTDGYTLSLIQSDVNTIKDTIIRQTTGQIGATNIQPHNQYEQRTYIKDSNYRDVTNNVITKPSIERIDINISGTLRIQSGNKNQNLNLDELFESPEFKRLLLNKINEGLSRNTNAVQTRSLDSVQSIMGGYYTPNQLNAK